MVVIIARDLALALVVLATGWPALAAQRATTGLASAIEAAVRQRMGDQVQVLVGDLDADPVAPDRPLRAVPDPNARAGRHVRFTLFDGPRRVGSVLAQVAVRADHLRAVRSVDRDRPLSADDVEVVQG